LVSKDGKTEIADISSKLDAAPTLALTHFYPFANESVANRPTSIEVALLHCGTHLAVKFWVDEPYVRAVNHAPQSAVWQGTVYPSLQISFGRLLMNG
jgi:hypothetical protein